MGSVAKQKTQKTAAKRVKRTGTGKLRIEHAYHGHLGTRKTAKRQRTLTAPSFVSKADTKQFNRLVPPGNG